MTEYISTVKTLSIALFGLTFLFSLALCDVYLHNPRGSNNRHDEDGRERRNAQRLFDSQNNNRGGYNVGNVYFFSGSKLQIEWTNQHSCGDQNTHCEIILQYMCDENLRDGTGPKGTNTIPVNNQQCLKNNCSTDYKYGMHEDYRYYKNCASRERNKGLFLADQNLRNRRYATSTRQNPTGQRYGYECPEERDYYPYWHPTPWKDIAVLTDRPIHCAYYRRESANVRERWDCRGATLRPPVPSTAAGCAAAGGNWTRTAPHGLPAPSCHEPQWTRDNHLGNTRSGHAPSYNWTIPSGVPAGAWCTLRIRYNITTGDYDGWSVDSSGVFTADIAEKMDLSADEAKARGYVFKTNPQVNVFRDIKEKLPLQLAINTQQFGRVFQDRSHAFRIRPSPVSGTIHNVNVRGKRGNIVQVYPAVEYDFIPNRHEIAIGDFVHFQWTGSNNNPKNNDGQGAVGTDRNNALLQAEATFSEPTPTDRTSFGLWSRSYPKVYNGANSSVFLGLSEKDVRKLAFSGSLDAREYLDTASTYFDLGPRKITRAGNHHYMSSRNNDFSNRSQKGLLVTGHSVSAYFAVGSQRTFFQTNDKSMSAAFAANSFTNLIMPRIQVLNREEGKKRVTEPPPGGDYVSDFYILSLGNEKPRQPIAMTIKVDTSDDILVLRGNVKTMLMWERLRITKSTSNSVTFLTNREGVFVARKSSNVSSTLIALLVVLAVLFIGGAIACLVIYFKRNPDSYRNIRSMCAAKV